MAHLNLDWFCLSGSGLPSLFCSVAVVVLLILPAVIFSVAVHAVIFSVAVQLSLIDIVHIIAIVETLIVVFRAIMRLSNELVYGGALQCADDAVACATLQTSITHKQVYPA